MTVQPTIAAFADRHIGPRGNDAELMLKQLGYDSLDALVDTAVPADIRQQAPLELPSARSESEVLADLRALAAKNV
ncbi:hypothetical protein LVY72_23340, partial [Arthrobacter sp. I2-34]